MKGKARFLRFRLWVSLAVTAKQETQMNDPSTDTLPNNPGTDTSITEEQAKKECPILASVSDRTRIRWEEAGRFPRRRHISPKIKAYSLREIREFNLDPEGWVKRHAGHDPQAA
jgi:hypothetical protein